MNEVLESRLEQAARDAQNEYARRWRQKNAEKVREYNRRYWLRRAEREGRIPPGTDERQEGECK